MAGRTTWKRLATILAAGLHDKTCTDHPVPLDDCPYCRDTAALQIYQAKLEGRCDWPWQDVVAKLAARFQHFAECTTHGPNDADPENCPFCHDETRWQQYVDFCHRRGVKPLRRDVDVMMDGAESIPLDDLRPSTWPRPTR